MSRTILTILLVAGLLLGLAFILVWYVSFGMARPDDGEVVFSSMDSRATVSYYEDGGVAISAQSEIDAYRALGYRMGRDHGWTAVLLRQTALGRLGEWFGEPVMRLDAATRRLGFAATSAASADAMDDDDRQILSAFASGMTRALSEEAVTLGPEFALFRITPEPWLADHSLAVGRLLTWLSEPPLAAQTGDSLFWSMRSFEDEDRLLRSWLHLHGADMSAAWAWSDSSGYAFSGRLVYGATALPLFSETIVSWPSVEFRGIELAGTPFFPVIAGRERARVTFLTSDRRIDRALVPADSSGAEWRYERLTDPEGDERIVAVPLLNEGLLLNGPEDAAGDDSLFTALILKWRGLGETSDWPGWRAAVRRYGARGTDIPSKPSFGVIDGDGLSVSTNRVSIEGSPPVEVSNRSFAFAGGNLVSAYAADQLRRASGDRGRLGNTDRSRWASENVDRLLELVVLDSSFDATTLEAIDYLENWDYRYDRSSIGGSVFDGWMLHLRAHRGDYPVFESSTDSLERAALSRRVSGSLRAAVDSMARIAGPDLARWRLEYFRAGERFYPVWSFGPLKGELPSINKSKYAPLNIPRPGHPTTIDWQPGLDDDPANSPSHVLFFGRTGDDATFRMTPDYEIGSGLIARYIAGPPKKRSGSVRKQIGEIVLLPD